MIKTTKPNPASARTCCAFELNFQLHFCRLSLQCVTTKHAQCLEHGFHNVSRWMTWLPISLKNAAKCDKWYQLQNHSITESLNANGAREKPSTAYPVHAVFSVSNKNPTSQKSLGLSRALRGLFGDRVVTPSPRHNVDSWVIQFYWTSAARSCARPGTTNASLSF